MRQETTPVPNALYGKPKMTTKIDIQPASEKAEVMLAFDRGAQVEIRHRDSAIWIHDSNPCWDWVDYEWRVMTKPAECWIWVYPDGQYGVAGYDSKRAAENAYTDSAGRAAFMREVI